MHCCLHWLRVPPKQRQHAKQSPVWSQLSQMVRGTHGVVVEQEVVMPLQVTCPISPTVQLRSTAVQVPEPEQLTVPVAQAAVAVQVDFSRPFPVAAKLTLLACVAQEPVSAGGLKIAARAALGRGTWLGVWAKPAIETRRRAQATIHAFFTRSSFTVSETCYSCHIPFYHFGSRAAPPSCLAGA